MGTESDSALGSGSWPEFEYAGSGDLGGSLGPLQYVQPVTQYVPPLPASQSLCLINGFDPGWGPPPSTYEGVVVQFDPALGAYRFSPNSASLEQAFLASGNPYLVDWFKKVSKRYMEGYMLQPYRPQGGSGDWEFRWIPRRQEVVCS